MNAKRGVEVFFDRLKDGRFLARSRAAGGYHAYFRVTGVDQLADDLCVRGARILEGPTDREYQQREVVVEHCHGLVLAFGEYRSLQSSSPVGGSPGGCWLRSPGCWPQRAARPRRAPAM